MVCLLIWPVTNVAAQENINVSNWRYHMPVLKDTSEVNKLLKRGRQLQKSKNDSAAITFYVALQNSKRLQYPDGIRFSITALSGFYVQKEKYQMAVDIYLETLRYYQNKPGFEKILSPLCNNLANVYTKQGNYNKAIQYYKQAILFLEQYQDRHSGEVYNNLGSLFIQMEQYRQALPYLDKAEQAATKERSYGNLASVYGNKGSYYAELGKWDSSFSYSFKALAITKEHKLTQLEFNVYVNIGEQYRRKGEPAKALPYLKEAQKISDQALPFYRNHSLNTIGSIYLDLKQYDSSIRYYTQSLSLAEANGLNKTIKTAHQGLAEAYQGIGDYKQSLLHYKAYQKWQDSVSSGDMKKSLSEWEVKYRTVEKDKKIIENELQINKQKEALRKKNIWIIAISAGILLLAALLVIMYAFYRISQHKARLQAEQMNLLLQQQEIEQLKAIMTGEEKERERMARELHDGIGGMLAAVKMNLSAMYEKQDDSDGNDENNSNDDNNNFTRSDKEKLKQVLDMLQDTTSEVRKTAHNLLPDILTRHNLEDALLIYCEHINLSKAMRVEFQFHADTSSLDKSIELFLYRITQELLQNILKHARATNAWLMIKQMNNKLSIIVEDNGSGFDPEATTQGYGLLNLRYRVKSLHGDINIQSVPNRGTTIHIEFDIEKLKTKPSLT